MNTRPDDHRMNGTHPMTFPSMTRDDLEPLQVADLTPDQVLHLGVLTGRAGRPLIDSEGYVMTDDVAAELLAID